MLVVNQKLGPNENFAITDEDQKRSLLLRKRMPNSLAMCIRLEYRWFLQVISILSTTVIILIDITAFLKYICPTYSLLFYGHLYRSQ